MSAPAKMRCTSDSDAARANAARPPDFSTAVWIFATSADRANTSDGFKKEKELGTYSGRLFFATTGDWAAAIQFRREKNPRMLLERVDWIQTVRPASEPGT